MTAKASQAPAPRPSTKEQPELFTLQSDEVLKHWHWIEPILSRVEDLDCSIEDVYQALANAQAQLWGWSLGIEPLGLLVTRIETVGNTKRGLLWLCAGNRIDLGLGFLSDHIEPWLQTMGCEYVQILGRKGWKNLLPAYDEKGIILVKHL